MHPAFSVIFFTTASGAGFGLLAWFGLLALAGGLPARCRRLALVLSAPRSPPPACSPRSATWASRSAPGAPSRQWRSPGCRARRVRVALFVPSRCWAAAGGPLEHAGSIRGSASRPRRRAPAGALLACSRCERACAPR
jgi:hypothetical protein